MVSTREIMAVIKCPGRHGYVAEIWYRVKEGERVRIKVEKIIEPYEKPLENLNPETIRNIKEKAEKLLEERLRQVMRE